MSVPDTLSNVFLEAEEENDIGEAVHERYNDFAPIIYTEIILI